MQDLLTFIQHNTFMVTLACLLALALVYLELVYFGSSAKRLTANSVGMVLSAKNSVLIDLRTSDDFNKAHIASAINHDYANLDLDALCKKTLKDQEAPIVIVCANGTKSKQLADKLKSRKFTNINFVENGMQGWNREGLPVVSGKDKQVKTKKPRKKNG